MPTSHLADAETAVCPKHQSLRNAAVRCESAAARFLGDDPRRVRARDMLITLGQHMHACTTIFDLDPTLADEPHSPRWRSVDLLIELSRQLAPLLRQACRPAGGWQVQQLWDEAEALFARAMQIAVSIPERVPRRDHATVAGRRAISAERLALVRHQIAQAAELVRGSAVHALRIDNPDPRALELVVLGDRLAQIAAELDEHEPPIVL